MQRAPQRALFVGHRFSGDKRAWFDLALATGPLDLDRG